MTVGRLEVLSQFYTILSVTMLNSLKRLSEQVRPDPSKQTLNHSLAVSHFVLSKSTVFLDALVLHDGIATASQNFAGTEAITWTH
ncbi:hypothetical protein CPB85DRAFT_203296 [Mucidula mucida]|nr:hypothetical protein CPB85DRAFT_203296 [Mucidula mucida]